MDGTEDMKGKFQSSSTTFSEIKIRKSRPPTANDGVLSNLCLGLFCVKHRSGLGHRSNEEEEEEGKSKLRLREL
ncbi:unnamed protein product [Cyprideis torosa]|uniref:Uncharacterized protein n=1 Tax=Cyprideis torosa TaxID=163714 RepID=A0A7R8W7I2_9CRUS|nr:unnamed protein product [Cyprideis torosa]CAG0887591.1 unnamed protein product [Cyprideis torosa]